MDGDDDADGRWSFSLLNVLLVIAILSILLSVTVFGFRRLQIHTELTIAAEQTLRMLQRAQTLSRAGEYASSWGIRVPDGVLFSGTGFAMRNASHDELYPFPKKISVIGAGEVSFSAVYGAPNVTGYITLEAINGERAIVPIPVGFGPKPAPPPDVLVRVTFERIRNFGDGSAQPTVTVGSPGKLYANNAWIPLRLYGKNLVDKGYTEAAGLSMKRSTGSFMLLEWAGLSPGGKEVIDAKVELVGATISDVLTGTGTIEMEGPFDGILNDGVGGDEIVVNSATIVHFYTRETNYGDALIVRWK